LLIDKAAFNDSQLVQEIGAHGGKRYFYETRGLGPDVVFSLLFFGGGTAAAIVERRHPISYLPTKIPPVACT